MSKIKKDTHTSADKAKKKYSVLNCGDYNNLFMQQRAGSPSIFGDEAIEGWYDDYLFREETKKYGTN
ncbi:MAG: hypothetical protein H6573_02765 [Lewinellaceae bacterium]|nr:hypothetical protein [Lewinellaceae bacterium]